MTQQLDIKEIIQIVNFNEPVHNSYYNKWEKLALKTLEHKFFLSFNGPVLVLGLLLWGGIFGGLWFVYRGMFLFGTFIWPIIVVATTFLMIIALGAPIHWDWSRTNWLLTSVIMGPIIAQFLLASLANYIYLYKVKKKIQKGTYQKLLKISPVKLLLSFIILLFITGLIALLKLPHKPPLLFWA